MTRRPNRIMIGLPMGEMGYARAWAQNTEMFVWAMKRGGDIVADVLPEVSNLVPDAHNRCVRRALEHRHPWDYLLILEQDHLLPRNMLARVANYTEPVVGSVYAQRLDPHWPTSIVPKPECWDDEDLWRGEGWTKDRMAFAWPSLIRQWRAAGQIERVLGMGMGATAIRRDVLERWPTERPFLHPSGDEMTEATFDVLFCREARRQGWEVCQDWGLVLPHLAVQPVDLDHHIQAMNRQLARQ